MDLREKPGKLQKMMELSLRIRLIFVVLLVVFTVSFLATGWNAMGSLPLGASEAFGMWFAQVEGFSIGNAQYLGIAAVAMFVLFFVFGGIRSGLGGIISASVLLGALFMLGGAEGMQTIFFGVFAVVALILLLFAKWSIACSLFPFALAWLLMTGFIAWFPMVPGNAWLVWAVLSVTGFASTVAFALAAGKELGEGAPQAGALVKASKKMFLPVVISSLLAMVAVSVDMANVTAKSIVSAAILWIVFVVWFFGFNFGTMAFAPWERLRAGSRRVQMKDKKKAKK